MLNTNTTKKKLKRGEAVFGCFFRYPVPTLAEYVATQGWDFMTFDGEHGSLEARDIEDLARAAELRGITPLARVTTNDPAIILRYLDAGAHGLHVPWVNTVEGVERAVTAAKYGPRGLRGLAGSRQGGWPEAPAMAEVTARANEETLIVIHIETADAVAAIEDYVAVDGVDVFFLGPTDLSHSLGHTGLPNHPEVQAAMLHVADVVGRSDKTLGVFVGSPQATAEWRDRGARYFTVGFEALVKQGMQNYLTAVRG